MPHRRQTLRSGLYLATVLALLLGPAAPVRAQDELRERFFYHQYEYGSQALYGPLWVFMNRGFDVLQDHVDTRAVLDLDYRRNAGNVLDNLAHPFSNVAAGGWGRFVSQELLPLTWTSDNARWMPNYALHLIGGGVTYTGLREWFEDHGSPYPRLMSAFTVMAAALVNESIENMGVVGRNTDAISDIYFFDLGGLLLFSLEPVNRFFSEQVVISDWSLQPAFTSLRGELQNQGNYFAAKWSLPFYPRLRLFAYFGEATAGGLSFRLDQEYSLSGAAGGLVTRLIGLSSRASDNVVRFAPTAALFLDRRESLLASLQLSAVYDYFIHFNLYPHALFTRGPGIGLFAVLDREGRLTAGLSFSTAFGLGAGVGSP
jgi:hypothetical protein